VFTQIIKFDKTRDYELLCSWFDQWNLKHPELDQLGEESWIIYLNGIPIAFSCFAKTDTKLAIMGFTIARKEHIEGKSEAIDKLINYIFKRVNDCGFKYLYYFTDTKVMVDRMERLGMTITDNGNAYILIKGFNSTNMDFYNI